MIPSNKALYSRLTQESIQTILFEGQNYFQIADEYVSLQRRFVPESLPEKIGLWFDMIISPLIMLVKSIYYNTLPDFFSLFSIQKCFTLWIDWFRFKELQSIVRKWISIVKSIGGPFISSNDAEYHIFVYADGMQRLSDSLRLVTKERAKRAK